MPAKTSTSKEAKDENVADLHSEQSKNLSEFARMYYEHQYDRMSKLESQELTISNLVLGISTLAYTFGFSGTQGINAINGVGLPVIVIAINLFTLLYFNRTGEFVATHRKRAKSILEQYAKEIYKVDQGIKWKKGFWSGYRVQSAIHIFLIIFAFLSIIYIKSVL